MKNKNKTPVEVMKALWEEYASIVLENFALQIESNLHHTRVRDICKTMKEFKFDFNSNRK